MRLPVRPLPLACLLLAVPVAFGLLPGAAAAPKADKPSCKPAKSCAAPAPTVTPPAARVVVADVDSGVNPYHEAYYAHGPSEVTPDVLAEFPGIQTVRLTRTGNLAADFAADKPFWDSVQRGKPYWFEGTNLIGISFDTAGVKIFSDKGDEHGTGTSTAVLDANPEAVVVMVEGINEDSESWAFTHPAVDIVTTSYGFPGSLPFPFHLKDSFTGVVELGKVHAGASDNSPALSPPDGTSGPWWTLGIAGFQEGSTEGRQLLSGNAVDFVGDFTQTLPYCSDCESGRRAVSGTSFATPRSAGTISAVVLQARRAVGHVGGIVTTGEQPALVAGNGKTVTTWQLRRALEEAAAFPTTAQFRPGGSVFDLTSAPVNDAAPWLQVGWGAITPDPARGVVTETLAQLGFGAAPTRSKTAANCEYQTANVEARRLYWDNVAVESESFGTDEDPFIRC